VRRHGGGDPRARHELIERYIPLARSLALRYRRSPEPLDDLIQVASLGLVKAVDRWDPERGLAFSTYAVPTILGELRRYFRDATWHIRPPRELQELCMSVERARTALNAESGREPTVADLAERLGRSREDVLEGMQAGLGRVAGSLDTTVHDEDDGSTTAGELIGRDDEGYARAEAVATIERMLSILGEREREVLRLRFDHDLLQSEIAERVGCSQMHVSRVLRSSLERLSAFALPEPASG